MEAVGASAIEPQGPPAAVVELVRPDASLAREAQQLQQPSAVEKEDQETEQQQQHARFAKIVLPLEAKARHRLKDPDRAVCFRSFVFYPEGFADVVDGLLDRSDMKYPLRLLVHCVEAGDPAEAQALHEQCATEVRYTRPEPPAQLPARLTSETPEEAVGPPARPGIFKCTAWACPFEGDTSEGLDEHVLDVHDAACVVCDGRQPDLVYRGGQWWCALHRGRDGFR
jgi:hypothetical protein